MQFPFSRRFAASLLLSSTLGVIASVSNLAAAAAVKTVEVTAIVEHAALDAVRDGVKDQLKADGFEEGKNLKFAYQSAQGNTGTAAQIAHKFVGDRPDVAVAIATPSAQALIAATRDIPIVFSAVTDPVAARPSHRGTFDPVARNQLMRLGHDVSHRHQTLQRLMNDDNARGRSRVPGWIVKSSSA